MINEISIDRKDRILISIYSASIGLAIITLAIVAALEIFMLGVSVVMTAPFGEFLWRYRIYYIVLLVAALVGIAVNRYVQTDTERRFRILKIANPFFACFLFGWALFVTYSDAVITGVVSPILFLTFSLVIPISFFVFPSVFAVITVLADVGMLVLTIVFTDLDLTIINLLVFYIFQFTLGVSFLRIRVMLAERLTEERERAEIDVMTGCMNRRVFSGDIENIKKDPAGDNLIFTVVDVNGLKDVNDRLGHAEGDRFIVETAAGLKTVFGNDGRVYRTGGDEFAVLTTLTEDDVESRLAGFDKIMKERSAEYDYELSASYGYAIRTDDQHISISELAKTADKNMYEAKKRYYKEKGMDRRKS